MQEDHRPVCFVVMGFGKKTDFETGRPLDLDATYNAIISPAVTAAGTVVYMSPESATSPWVAWEVARSLELGKKVLAVYKGTTKPALNFPAVSDNDIKCVAWKDLAAEIASLD